MEYQKICTDVEYLTRVYISYKYLTSVDQLKNCNVNLKAVTDNIVSAEETIKQNEADMLQIDEVVNQMQNKIDQDSGGELKVLEEKFKKITEADLKANGDRDSAKENIEVETRKLKALQKGILTDENALKKKQNDMAKVEEMFQKLKDTSENDAKAFEESQKRFEAVSNGLSTNEDGEAESLQDQLMNARQQNAEATTKITKNEMELKHCQNLLREKQNESQTSDSTYTRDKKQLDRTTNEVTQMTDELSRIQYEEGTLERLEERRSALSNECRKLKNDCDLKGAQNFTFSYADPEPNFNKSSVKGMVCKLFDVRNKRDCVALGIVAAGKLYNVVVDTDTTSKKLLERGRLTNRTTFIPMNKISAGGINRQMINTAKKLAGEENIAAAIDLITYPPEYETVMRFVFGNVLVCKDLKIANAVAFNRSVSTRCVTLDGDVVDPDGSLSGGSLPKGGSVLLNVAEIKQLEDNYNRKKNEEQQIIREIAKIEPIARKYDQLKEQIEMKQMTVVRLQQSISLTVVHQHQQEIEELGQKVASLREEINSFKKIQETSRKKVKDVENKLADSKGHRERELKAAEDEMKQAQKKSETSRKNWTKREQEFEVLKLEIVELQKSLETSTQQFRDQEQSLVDIKQQLTDLTKSCQSTTQEVNAIKAMIKVQKDLINSQHKELKGQLVKKSRKVAANQDLQLNIKKLETDIVKINSVNNEAKSHLNNLEKKYIWIKDDKDKFGVVGTSYDYQKENPQLAGEKLKKLQDQKEVMGRNINQKAMMLLQNEEEQFKIVTTRKRIVEADKEKILQIIKRLDEKKKQAVKKAWQEVNINFGGIFSNLLPGSDAKLQPPEGRNFNEGLEVKVGFNGLWKESLTELSGGQRSLVALSLILAMLKFKPAPLYILDEVDAALDLSHTQNIGNMLKSHFTNSQFIIVSLKDGMFNNANVLFRTKFIDGMSGVTRTVNQHNINRR